MADLAKAFTDILREFGGPGIALFLGVLAIVVMGRLLLSDRSKRDQDIANYVKIIESNVTAFREMAKRMKDLEAKVEPFVSKLAAQEEAKRLEDAVKAELKRRERNGHDSQTF